MEGFLQHKAYSRSAARRWLIRYPRALPLGIFALIAGIIIVSVWSIERGEAQRHRAEANGRAIAIASAMEQRINASSAYLRAGAALISTMQDVPAADFRRFVDELRLAEDARGAEGIGWARVVRPGEEAAFEEQASNAVRAQVTFHPRLDGSQPYGVPVTFLNPDTERARRALGFDMYSEEVRRSAMMQAEKTGRATATDRIVLRQEGGVDAAGFLIYMPVYEASAQGRRVKGYIYSPFNGQNFLEATLDLEQSGDFGVRLYDGELGEAGLIASSFNANEKRHDIITKTLTVADNVWILTVSRPSDAGLSGLSMASLIFGLLLASLLMLVVRILTRQAKEDEALIKWFAEQASIRNTLTRELNHRVKNTLANVLSIIALTRRRSSDLDEFANGLDGRIRALSATHDLLTQSDWGSTPVRSVLDAELLPYARGDDRQVTIEGPSVELAPNDALSLGLAIHELATNAAKYGALSQASGTVNITWQCIDGGLVRVEWLERGGPPVKEKRSRGFGTDLIERIVAHELRHPVELEFDPAGVRCVLLIPVRRRKEFLIRAAQEAKEDALLK